MERGAHWPVPLSAVAQVASWSPWPRSHMNLPLPRRPRCSGAIRMLWPYASTCWVMPTGCSR
jgi:hypothetical protein